MTPPPAGSGEPVQPMQVNSVRIVAWGCAAWGIALLVALLVPALHTGPRHWWPWACLSGLGLGLVGLAYLVRGRGNAADAR